MISSSCISLGCSAVAGVACPAIVTLRESSPASCPLFSNPLWLRLCGNPTVMNYGLWLPYPLSQAGKWSFVEIKVHLCHPCYCIWCCFWVFLHGNAYLYILAIILVVLGEMSCMEAQCFVNHNVASLIWWPQGHHQWCFWWTAYWKGLSDSNLFRLLPTVEVLSLWINQCCL